MGRAFDGVASVGRRASTFGAGSRRIAGVGLAVLLGLLARTGPATVSEAARDALALEPVTLVTAAGPRGAERGVLTSRWRDGVPIEVPVHRFPGPAEGAGPPLYLLAGGPGGTYLDDLADDADFVRWLDAFRVRQDVLLVEQRGARTTPQSMPCATVPAVRERIRAEALLTAEGLAAAVTATVHACARRWREDRPFAAFTIAEMAEDVHRVRRALGHERIALMGGSFGSQWAQAVMARAPESIAGAILYGVEGLDDTLDDPAETQAHVDRAMAALGASTPLRWIVGAPDRALAARVEELDRMPLRGRRPGPDGAAIDVALGAYGFKQILLSGEALRGYRDGIARVGLLLAAMELGLDRYALDAKQRLVEAWTADPAPVELMPLLVDCTSLDDRAAARPVLASTTGAPSVLDANDVDLVLRAACAALAVPRLPASARALPVIEAPVLLVSGDLDGFTPPVNAERLAAKLPNARLLRVRHGDHDGWAALADDARIRRTTLAFAAGDAPLQHFPERLSRDPPAVFPVSGGHLLAAAALGAILLATMRMARAWRGRGRSRASPDARET